MQRDVSAFASSEFDVAIVGGGICGAAAAWDAAQRGFSVALLERGDFAEATSANSLKVVHGGIRYLQHFDLMRVRESSRERSTLLRIAPHLVHPMPVLVPTFGHGIQGREVLATPFLLLNALTWDRNRGIGGRECRIPRARLLSRAEALERCPEIEHPALTRAGLFWDGQLINPQRLVWEFVRTVALAGAVVANYCEVRTRFPHRRWTSEVPGVPVLTRWFVKAGMLYLVAALLLGVAMQGPPAARFPVLRAMWPIYLHLLVVGWLTQLIFGVAY